MSRPDIHDAQTPIFKMDEQIDIPVRLNGVDPKIFLAEASGKRRFRIDSPISDIKLPTKSSSTHFTPIVHVRQEKVVSETDQPQSTPSFTLPKEKEPEKAKPKDLSSEIDNCQHIPIPPISESSNPSKVSIPAPDVPSSPGKVVRKTILGFRWNGHRYVNYAERKTLTIEQMEKLCVDKNIDVAQITYVKHEKPPKYKISTKYKKTKTYSTSGYTYSAKERALVRESSDPDYVSSSSSHKRSRKSIRSCTKDSFGFGSSDSTSSTGHVDSASHPTTPPPFLTQNLAYGKDDPVFHYYSSQCQAIGQGSMHIPGIGVTEGVKDRFIHAKRLAETCQRLMQRNETSLGSESTVQKTGGGPGSDIESTDGSGPSTTEEKVETGAQQSADMFPMTVEACIEMYGTCIDKSTVQKTGGGPCSDIESTDGSGPSTTEEKVETGAQQSADMFPMTVEACIEMYGTCIDSCISFLEDSLKGVHSALYSTWKFLGTTVQQGEEKTERIVPQRTTKDDTMDGVDPSGEPHKIPTSTDMIRTTLSSFNGALNEAVLFCNNFRRGSSSAMKSLKDCVASFLFNGEEGEKAE
ncbi:hypothetical protein ADUPG1_007258 [Aduncisulcus paluster]|uniref:Uncharacterized protein n=1 Tax=Aduncisulcus paluster TaxID=2918883 RepID=A0ABQ5KLB4_9EUKA|nr:hypothetical protein ADUPG1_007258 [Aduncisulcus paluster]